MGKLHEMEKELKVGQTKTSSEERMLGVMILTSVVRLDVRILFDPS